MYLLLASDVDFVILFVHPLVILHQVERPRCRYAARFRPNTLPADGLGDIDLKQFVFPFRFLNYSPEYQNLYSYYVKLTTL